MKPRKRRALARSRNGRDARAIEKEARRTVHIGSIGGDAGLLQPAQYFMTRMMVHVADSHRDYGKPRMNCRQQFLLSRCEAAVMGHLQHVRGGIFKRNQSFRPSLRISFQQG